MTGLVEILKNFCLSLSTQDRTSTDSILKGVNGRDGFGPKLRSWLESSRDVFPETVRVEFTEHISDRGVDVYIEGQATQTGVGFQIKSDNDVRDENFLPNLKRQVTDARAYANLKLYIIVMACSTENFGKIQFALNEELNQWRAGIPEIILLVPGKAASLYQHCDSQLSKDELGRLLKDRSWNRFFVESGAIDRENEFLNHWSGLDPQERFAAPRNLERIENSLARYPLTVLVGPPTIGKTYTTAQLLYEHFKQGGSVEWIAPPGQEPANFIVTVGGTPRNFTQRVHALARRLGMVPSQPPRNRWEFIAARLQAGSLIFIEDPFGRTEEEFRSSLHTYDFFDLDGCIEGILKEQSAQDCRLIMTSRHALLDAWLEERRRKLGQEHITIPEGMNVIHLGPDNYRGIWFRNSGPLFDLASKLMRSSGKVNEKDIEELSATLAEGLDTPQAVEFVIASLPQHVDKEAIQRSIENFPRDALQQIQVLCEANNDSERLFLWVLSESSTGHAIADFATMYAQLYHAMRLTGDAAMDDVAARAKYDLLYYPRDYNETNAVYGEDRKPLRWGVYLSAAHPSIIEESRRQVTHNGNGFLNRFAHSLLNLRGDPLLQAYLDRVAYFLAEELDSLDNTAIEQLSLILPDVIKPTFGMEKNIFDLLLRRLDQLPDALHQALIEAVQNGDPLLATKACDHFRYSSVPR